MLRNVAVQLKRNIDVCSVEVLLRIFIDIHRHGGSIHSQADVVDLVIDALQFPGNVVPRIGGKHRARQAGRHPFKILRVPDVPVVCIFEIAFAAPDKTDVVK